MKPKNTNAVALGALTKGIKKKISLAEKFARARRLAKVRNLRWPK